MIPFEYVRATDVAGAVAAGSVPGAAYLAAGTNLLDLMKGDVARPTRLVDITRLPGLSAVERRDDGSVRIGALSRNSDLAHDPAFARPIRRWRKRCCRVPRRSCAMPPRPRAT